MDTAIVVGTLVLLGVAHSLLGEQSVLRPLFASTWSLPDIPRDPAERLLRFAWHLTSIAWLGLAAVAFGVASELSIAVVCILSGSIIFAALPGHLAWPVFLLGGIAALNAGGAFPGVARWTLVGAAAAVASGASALHLYWAVGGRRWLDRVIPSNAEGVPLFRPGPAACVAVAAALLVFAGLLIRTMAGSNWWEAAATGVALVVLTARAVGDGRQVGFTKTNRRTDFAQADDAIYTPVVVLLALGAAVALLPV